MPSINIPITQSGPILDVLIGPSIPRQEALKAAGHDVPVPVYGRFLVDTGASSTCVDDDLMRSLGITPTGQTNIQTPSTQGKNHTCNLYDVMLFIANPAGGGHLIEALPIIETHLSSQGIDGLIGRDILDNHILIYNGNAKIFTFSY